MPACPLLSITLLPPCKKGALCTPSHTQTHTHTHTHRATQVLYTQTATHGRHPADAGGQTPAECLSPLLLASATAWHCGRDDHLLSPGLDWKGQVGMRHQAAHSAGGCRVRCCAAMSLPSPRIPEALTKVAIPNNYVYNAIVYIRLILIQF